MSYSLIPPEINSALMYSGAGSGPLLEAAATWDGLASDLEATATQYQTAITNLTTGPWLGPSSAQMASAAAPYIAWLQGTATTAAQTGTQAKVAAAAYQTAYSSMVPPPVITANRTELTTLVSNNFLGQNTGAIANNEADYLSMWIQDALGMDTYNQSSQAAAALPAQAAAPQVANGSLASTAVAAATPASSSSSVITGLLGDFADLFGASSLGGPADLSAGGLTTWLGGLATAASADPSAALLPVQVTYYMGMLGSTPARMFMSSGSSSGAGSSGMLAGMSDSLLGNVGKLVDTKAAAVLAGVGGQMSKWGSGIQASMASAMHAGGLSVPHSWHTGVPDMGRAAPSLPATSVAAPSLMHGLPSSPFSQGLMGALAGRGMSSMGSRVAAKVMPRSPAGG
ncbi:MAG: PPE family protein [Mycobacterium sp.]